MFINSATHIMTTFYIWYHCGNPTTIQFSGIANLPPKEPTPSHPHLWRRFRD